MAKWPTSAALKEFYDARGLRAAKCDEDKKKNIAESLDDEDFRARLYRMGVLAFPEDASPEETVEELQAHIILRESLLCRYDAVKSTKHTDTISKRKLIQTSSAAVNCLTS